MTTKYSGIAVGGPYDGKPIHHGEDVYRVAIRSDGKVVTWFGSSTPDVTVRRYVFKKGKWIWKEK